MGARAARRTIRRCCCVCWFMATPRVYFPAARLSGQRLIQWRFLDELTGIFVQVLKLAQEMSLLKLGAISLYGTKVHANASRHNALSHGHIEKIEAHLKAEVQELLALAEQADRAIAIAPSEPLRRQLRGRRDRLEDDAGE